MINEEREGLWRRTRGEWSVCNDYWLCVCVINGDYRSKGIDVLKDADQHRVGCFFSWKIGNDQMSVMKIMFWSIIATWYHYKPWWLNKGNKKYSSCCVFISHFWLKWMRHKRSHKDSFMAQTRHLHKRKCTEISPTPSMSIKRIQSHKRPCKWTLGLNSHKKKRGR